MLGVEPASPAGKVELQGLARPSKGSPDGDSLHSRQGSTHHEASDPGRSTAWYEKVIFGMASSLGANALVVMNGECGSGVGDSGTSSGANGRIL
jgi:hypothetical protein